MTVKEKIQTNNPIWLFVTALILVVLQGGNLVGVAINRTDIKHNAEMARLNYDRIDMIYDDYVPMWFLEGLQQNMNYQTQEIVATMDGNMEKVKEINIKYLDFQKTMLNNLAQMRAGYTPTPRGTEINK